MKIFILFLLSSVTIAQDLPPAPRPKVFVILNKVDAKIVVDKVRRMFPKLTKGYGRYEDRGARVRFKISEVNDEIFTGCQNYPSYPEVCLFNFYRYLKQNKSMHNGELYHLITPAIFYNNKYYLGGAAFRNCYRWIKTDRNDWNQYTGVSYSHFVLTQTDGTTRFPAAVLALLHETGHATFNLIHTRPKSKKIMNSFFNVLGYDQTIPIKNWRFSKKSLKKIHKCYRNPVLGGL